MTVQRWVTLAVICGIAIVAAVFIYYRYVQLPYWSDEAKIRTETKEAAQLDSVSKATKYVWEHTYWIIEGVDGEGEDVYIWTQADKDKPAYDTLMLPLVIKASESVSKSDIKDIFKQAKPDADIKRIQPGMLNGEPVWEIYYSRDEHTTKYYYEFYRFRDGSYVTEYALPAKYAP
ncbi:hypothetical protein GOM71_05780 [Paenibacillus sp. NEAU-GSW1]|nr:hypothetical protein [Paenibacillus sp. NEAU-GSW1]